MHLKRLIHAVCLDRRNAPGRFSNATLVRLSEYLSDGYKTGVRPVTDWKRSTMVSIDLMVYAILSVVRINILL